MIEIKNFTICAERDTGTNYMQRLIPQAFGINMTWDYGPKHFMGWHDSGLVDAHNTLCICMVRNPYDWLMALFKTKHHVPYGTLFIMGIVIQITVKKEPMIDTGSMEKDTKIYLK